MKSIIVAAVALVAVVVTAPLPPEYNSAQPIEILEKEFVIQPDSNYNYRYKTANGITVEQSGQLKEVLGEENKPQNVIVVKGFYSYLDEDDKPVIIEYTADENGYRAEGESIPKVPAVGFTQFANTERSISGF